MVIVMMMVTSDEYECGVSGDEMVILEGSRLWC